PFTYFGRAAARLDDAANFLPARLTAGLIVVASKITGEDARSAAILWQRDGMLHASPNAGQSEAAMAGALNVRLGGVNYYDGVEHKSGYFGTEFTLPTARAARRSIRIVIAASVTAYAIAGLINWWRRK
ncbi:MAG: cobalamin biosynthesis protein, partial [Pyrinomonadaceae bacterium]